MLRTNQNARIPLPAGLYHGVLRTSQYTFAGAVANAAHAAPPMTTTEFSIQRAYTTDRSTTLRWVLSHVRQNRLLIGGVFFGAFSNAALVPLPRRFAEALHTSA